MQALADRALRITERAAEVIGRDGFEDDARRVGFVFPRICSELVEALSALKHLKNSEAVLSPSFLDREFRGAPDTGRVLLLAFEVGHGEGLRVYARRFDVRRPGRNFLLRREP